MGSYCLISSEFQLWKMEGVCEMDSPDGDCGTNVGFLFPTEHLRSVLR